MKNFKDIIANRRKELNLTQKELASKLNVSDKTISKWETGSSYPDIFLLKKIVEILDIDINDIFYSSELNLNNKTRNNDNDELLKYRNKVFYIIAAIISSFVLISFGITLENESTTRLMMALGLIIYLTCIILTTLISYNFYSQYKNFTNRIHYDKVYSKYSFILIITFLLPFIIMPLISSDSINISTIGGLINLFSMVIVFGSFVLIYKIYKITNFKIIKDKINLILQILVIVFFLLIATNLFSILFLPLLYFKMYIIISRKETLLK